MCGCGVHMFGVHVCGVCGVHECVLEGWHCVHSVCYVWSMFVIFLSSVMMHMT